MSVLGTVCGACIYGSQFMCRTPSHCDDHRDTLPRIGLHERKLAHPFLASFLRSIRPRSCVLRIDYTTLGQLCNFSPRNIRTQIAYSIQHALFLFAQAPAPVDFDKLALPVHFFTLPLAGVPATIGPRKLTEIGAVSILHLLLSCTKSARMRTS